MTATLSLDQLRIASPCPMQWDQMTPTGAAGIRRCDQCDLNVHNVSEMTAAQADAFLAGIVPGVRTCIGYYRRADGTILTRDCPVGLRATRAHLARVITRTAAALTLLITGVAIARSRPRDEMFGGLANSRPFSALCEWVRGRPAQSQQQFLAGDICPPGN